MYTQLFSILAMVTIMSLLIGAFIGFFLYWFLTPKRKKRRAN